MPFRPAAGIRALPYAIISCIHGDPPLVMLLSTAAATALQWNPGGYCSAPLLLHPLGRRRVAHAAAVLELAFMMPLEVACPLVAEFARPLPLHESAGASVGGGNVVAACGDRPVWLAGSHALSVSCTCRAGNEAASDSVCRATVSFLHVAVGVLVPTLATAYVGGGARTTAPARGLRRLGACGDRCLRYVAAVESGRLQRAAVAWYIAANAWLLCCALV